jgi:protein gp37
MSKTKIDWCDEVWNPTTGCSKISEGCKNCYAEKMANRLQKMGCKKYANGFRIKCHVEELYRQFPGKGKRIFANSMSDLFHDEVTDDFIDRVICTIALNPQHTFLLLTKRAERMRDYFQGAYKRLLSVLTQEVYPSLFKSKSGVEHLNKVSELRPEGFLNHWPLKNLWLGVSVENQKAADERIPLLLKTPAALRFVSFELMLEEIDLDIWGGDYFCPACNGFFDIPAKMSSPCCGAETNGGDNYNCPECGEKFDESAEIPECPHCGNSGGGPCIQPDVSGCFRKYERLESIDWVICGCESGANRRPFNADWARSLRDQCKEADVPFFLKQMPISGKIVHTPELDGKVWNQIPEVSR